MQKQVIEFKITPDIKGGLTDYELLIDELVKEHVEDLKRTQKKDNDDIVEYLTNRRKVYNIYR